MVTPNDLCDARKARLAIPIQINVCLFIYPNVQDDVRLVYWTLGVPKASVKFHLLCRPLHLASIKIVVTFDYPNLRADLLGLLRIFAAKSSTRFCPTANPKELE